MDGICGMRGTVISVWNNGCSSPRSTIGYCPEGSDLPKLALPELPRVLPPEIVSPQEAALDEVLTQTRGLVLVEMGRPDLGHHDERTPKEHRIGETNEHVFRVALRISADRRLGQLRQADRQVLVRPRPVHAPVATVTVAIAVKRHPAELKRSVEVLEFGELQASTPVPAAAPLRARDGRCREDYSERRHDEPRTAACVPQAWA